MGASQSVRKLTIVNEEDDVNVIKISKAVAQRLSHNAAETSVEPVTKDMRAAQMQTATLPARTANPHELAESYYPQYTISALEVQQQKEKELAEQEAYWQRRLQNLERSHEKINHYIEQEYKKALTIFDDCRVVKVQGAIKPCNANSQKVLKCYQDNPKETLRCADLVQEFSNCVDQRRAQLMRCN